MWVRIAVHACLHLACDQWAERDLLRQPDPGIGGADSEQEFLLAFHARGNDRLEPAGGGPDWRI